MHALQTGANPRPDRFNRSAYIDELIQSNLVVLFMALCFRQYGLGSTD